MTTYVRLIARCYYTERLNDHFIAHVIGEGSGGTEVQIKIAFLLQSSCY